MLKLIIAGLFWDSRSPTPASSDDTDKEDKAEATSVCPWRYAGDGMCHFTPRGPCPSGVTPKVAKGHRQISSSKQVMGIIDGLGLKRSCTAAILQVGKMGHRCLAGCSRSLFNQ